MTRKDWTLLVIAASEKKPLQPVHLQKSLFLLARNLSLGELKVRSSMTSNLMITARSAAVYTPMLMTYPERGLSTLTSREGSPIESILQPIRADLEPKIYG
jgi:hypothetical protein